MQQAGSVLPSISPPRAKSMPRVADVRTRLDGNRWTCRADGAASHLLWCDGYSGITTLSGPDGIERQWTDPLDALRWMAAAPMESAGRWIGFLSYDLGRFFEQLPPRTSDEHALPLFVFSHHNSEASVPQLERRDAGSSGPVHCNFTRRAYEAAVERVIEYVGAGDVFQVNLSQRFTVETSDSPDAIYSRLLPAAFGACLDYGDFALLCNSPELFLRVTPDRRVLTRPIKGTRPRSPGMKEELQNSRKDEAELNMIVDLERNDLGRVCEIGSIKVIEPRVIESHPTVYHGVASIEGRLRPDVGFVDLLAATFPGGSVTGAPKIRAMQIIDELEPVRRGPYCGAIGYVASGGSMEFNVAIRTMTVENGRVHIQVGGGIVADSDPREEYEETLVKARAMFAALGVKANAGF